MFILKSTVANPTALKCLCLKSLCLKNFGVKKTGLKLGVEKSRNEMSCNRNFFNFLHTKIFFFRT